MSTASKNKVGKSFQSTRRPEEVSREVSDVGRSQNLIDPGKEKGFYSNCNMEPLEGFQPNRDKILWPLCGK